MSKSVHLQVLDSGVALLTIDLPGTKVNVLSSAVMAELDAAIDAALNNRSVRGLVITSGKKDNFIAGADITEILAVQAQPPVVAFNAAQQGKAIFAKLAQAPFITVAAIHGTCLGGGTELAAACKRRVVSRNRKTRLGLPEVGLGFIPGWGGTVRLPKLVGAEAALELIGNPLGTWDAGQAWRRGLVDEVVDESELVSRACQLALGARPRRSKPKLSHRLRRWFLNRTRLGRHFLDKGARAVIYKQTQGNLPAPVAALDVVLAALSQPEDKAFHAESMAFARLAPTPESRNLVGVWLASQEAKKSPEGVRPNLEVDTVGVLGAGVMGAGIAQAALYAGYRVVLYDKFPEGLSRGVAAIRSLFQSLVDKGKMTGEQLEEHMSRLTATTEYAPLGACQLVVEAIIEDLPAKIDAVENCEKVIPSDFIFASNTSSLPVTAMARAARNPALVAGLHFFNPVHKMPPVEIVRTELTSEQTLATLRQFATRLGKTAITTADAPGFVVNRILAPYLYESIRLMEQGVPVEEIDKAMVKYGMPMGPLTLLDRVGLDICTKVIHVLHDALGERMAPPRILDYVSDNKLTGVKGGKGIYLYEEGGDRPQGVNPDFLAALAAKRAPRSRQEIASRLELAMINEAARCVQENIAADVSQIDLAMVLGTGYPPFRGGPLRRADQLGLRSVVHKLSLLAQVAGDNYKPCDLLVRMAEEGRTFYSR